jgi:hypothetical protein
MPGDDVPPDDVLDRRGQRRRLILAALVGFLAGYGALHGTIALVRHSPMKGAFALLLTFPGLGAGLGGYLTYRGLNRRARRRWFRAQIPTARVR